MEKNVVRQETSPAMLIQLAVEGGADLEKLKGLLDLQERYEANEARKIYCRDMVAVQKNIPLVAKALKNPQTHSMYASLDDIICKTKEVYTEQGFSISFYEGETQKENHVRICADVIHSAGHKEQFFYDVPMDGKGLKGNANMTQIHGKASSFSYGRRYLMCMIWNIPTGNDGDGNVPLEAITETQVKTLDNILKELKGDKRKEKFLAYMKVDSLEKINEKDFKKALMAVSKARDGK